MGMAFLHFRTKEQVADRSIFAFITAKVKTIGPIFHFIPKEKRGVLKFYVYAVTINYMSPTYLQNNKITYFRYK